MIIARLASGFVSRLFKLLFHWIGLRCDFRHVSDINIIMLFLPPKLTSGDFCYVVEESVI